MTKTFIVTGSTVRVRDKNAMQAHEQLPPDTYTVKLDEQAGEFYLDRIGSFELPDKIYGKNNNYATRILNTFDDRPGSTGVLLSGVKGAGKTLLAKQVSVQAAERGVPTIVINKDWHGDEFNSFIQSITTPAIILFDEFEKIYGYTEQRKILTLFDGVFPSRKLFLVTTNADRDISEFMTNRPGRIFYNFAFDTLEQSFIEEFLADRLNDKSQIESVLKYTNVFSFFNFDMLNAAVEEMNRYDESLVEVLEVLNITPENSKKDTFKVDMVINGKKVVLDRTYHNFQPNNFEYRVWTDQDMPAVLSAEEELERILKDASGSKGDGEECIVFTPNDVKNFDATINQFVYSMSHNGKEIELHVTRNDPLDKWKYNPDAF
jgi:hypothetical protein